jgi:hypothetical protein
MDRAFRPGAPERSGDISSNGKDCGRADRSRRRAGRIRRRLTSSPGRGRAAPQLSLLSRQSLQRYSCDVGGSNMEDKGLGRAEADGQRVAQLLVDAFGAAAQKYDLSETAVRNLVFRVVQAGLVQDRRVPTARRDLAKTLGPHLVDLDPVPYATVEQARRLAGLRTSLLRQGAFSTAAIADGRATTAENARQWVSRHRTAQRIFTVTYDGETLVPAFLLDNELEPRPVAYEPVRVLRNAGEDGWALWAWFATPSAWVGGHVPADLLVTDPQLVAEGARQRAASSAA